MNRKRAILASSLIFAITSLHAPGAHAVRVDYTIDTGFERDDNVLLSDISRNDATSWRAGLGFLLSEDTSTVQAHIDGRLESWKYLDGEYSDTVEGRLSGRVNWFLVPQTFSLTAENSLDLETIDRFAPASPNNRQRVNVFSAGPNLHFNIGRAQRLQLEGRWINSHAEETTAFNSQRTAAVARLVRQLTPTSAFSLSLQAQDVDFDDDLMARDYRRYDAYARFEHALARLTLALDAGTSRIEYDSSESASHPLVRADVNWQATDTSALNLVATHQLSDAASAAIAGIETGNTVPGRLVTGTSLVDASAYEQDSLVLTYAYTGALTGITIGPYYESIDYIDDTSLDEDRRGARFHASRSLTRGWELGLHADLTRTTYRQLDLEQRDRSFGASLGKQWTPNWSTSVRYSRYTRQSEALVGDNIRQNVIYVMLTYQNR